VTALALSAPIYGLLAWGFKDLAFLNRMAITFTTLLAVLSLITLKWPRKEIKPMPERSQIETHTHRSVPILGSLVILAVIVFYLIFW
jgi:SSS family solute:Na+ symporter